VEIILLGPGDVDRVVAAAPLFDEEPKPEATQHFLAEPTHHLLIAYEEEVPVGFVTGVEMTHPDKGTEMFLYELGVGKAYRRRGIGLSLVQRLADIARSRGCYGMWVGTDPTNAAALATYQRSGASRDDDQVVILSWRFSDPRGR
jgi:ribosomal protein S18 acetylase RimI-like enzyme